MVLLFFYRVKCSLCNKNYLNLKWVVQRTVMMLSVSVRAMILHRGTCCIKSCTIGLQYVTAKQQITRAMYLGLWFDVTLFFLTKRLLNVLKAAFNNRNIIPTMIPVSEPIATLKIISNKSSFIFNPQSFG